MAQAGFTMSLRIQSNSVITNSTGPPLQQMIRYILNYTFKTEEVLNFVGYSGEFVITEFDCS
jgi:hypothetical protein